MLQEGIRIVILQLLNWMKYTQSEILFWELVYNFINLYFYMFKFNHFRVNVKKYNFSISNNNFDKTKCRIDL